MLTTPDAMTDLKRQGVGAVSSFMGHFEAGSEEPRFSLAARAVLNLSDRGLAAAADHLQACQIALEEGGLYDLVPADERDAAVQRRTDAVMTAFVLVWDAMDSAAARNYAAG